MIDLHFKDGWDIKAKLPNTVWATDVTGFKVGEKKLYLSPIKDLCSCNIVSYNLSTSPNFSQITNMLNEAFSKGESLNGLNIPFRSRLAIPNEAISEYIKRKRNNLEYEQKRNIG